MPPKTTPPTRQKAPQPALRDASRGERLQRLLARAGVGSRRACEALVASGAVEVNGAVVDELPAWIDPAQDRVVVEGRPVKLSPERRIYVMLNKPKRFVTTASDEEGRKTVCDIVEHPSGARLYPVGRLDVDTSGLLLMTNDGELANKLTHPRYGVPKTYRAVVKGRLTDEETEALANGVFLAKRRDGRTSGGARTAGVALTLVRRERERTILDITLKEGQNRQVRRMLAQVGHPVRKLTRTTMGPLKLSRLPIGAWRELTPGEQRSLRGALRAKPRVKPERRP